MDRITKYFSATPHFAAGRAKAESEIVAGSLGYRVYGKVDWETCEEAAKTLRDRYQIELQVDGHCVVSVDSAANAEGYNVRMEEEFQRRFGGDVVDTVFREVERKRKKRTNSRKGAK